MAEFVQTVKHWCAPLVMLAFWIWTYVCVIPSQKVKTLAEKIFGGDHGKKTPPNSILSPDQDNFKVSSICSINIFTKLTNKITTLAGIFKII